MSAATKQLQCQDDKYLGTDKCGSSTSAEA